MKKFSMIAASVLAVCVAGAAAAKDKDTVTRTLDLKGFEKIDVAGVYDLDIRVGPDFSIELSGPDYEMSRVESSVEKGVLRLDQREASRSEKKRWRNKRQGVDAVITLPNLTALEISGVVEGTAQGISTETFEVDISGVGEIELSGECGELDANVSGVGDLDAEELKCRNVEIRLSGVGDASVYARDEVDASVSGMGDIDVYGSPEKVSKSNSMFADVTVH
ncbi:MAG: hypothetical protein DHS20C05_23810 [Hyphococcus sp.]|nr:MAG: hypothetical protein DHS20C05_23810 [Marinicaulis sp.]